MLIKILQETGVEPITIGLAKKYLRIRSDHDDELIIQLIKAVRIYAEKYIRISLISKDIELTYTNTALHGSITMPYPPIISINNITIIDINQNINLISQDNYALEGDILNICGYLQCATIKIEYKAGYTKVSDDIKTAMLSHMSSMYADRGNLKQGPPPAAATATYDQYKIRRII